MRNYKYEPIDIFNYLILGIPIWALLGAKFAVFHLFSFIAFILLINKKKEKKKVFKIKEIYGIGIYLLSTIIALIINPLNAKGENLLSPIYLLSFWVMGVLIIITFKNSKGLTQKKIYDTGKFAFLIGGITIIVFILSFMVAKIKGISLIEFNGLSYYILPEKFKIRFFDSITLIKLLSNDYGGNGFVVRFNGFEVYQVASATLTLILAVYSYIYIYCKNFKNRYMKFIIIFSYYSMILVTLYFNRSRTIILGSILALLITLFIKYINKKNYKKIIIYFIFIFIAITLISYFSGILDKLINIRPNSNRDRTFVYIKALETFKIYPVFGVGIRYFISESAIPVGSHSTYLGVLMRSGIVGFLGIVMYKISILIKILNNKKYIFNSNFKKVIWNISTFIFIFMSIFMVFEDIDWPNIVAFLYFFNVAIIISFEKIKSDDCKSIDNLKIALVGSSGGHLTHLVQIDGFWKDKERFWVTFEKPDAISQLRNEKAYWCYFPTNRNIKNLIKNTYLAIKILIKEKPDLIVSSGAAVAIPFFYIGKILNIKLVYIEVYDRIDTPTMTGRLVYPICDEFIVQWEEQLKFYPKAKMIGGIF